MNRQSRMQTKIIHILGASGAGVTTLGRAVALEFGYTQFDSDNYFWQPTNPKFTDKRPKEQRIDLMRQDLENVDRAVISGTFCNWGNVFIPYFELVINVETPTSIRLERLKAREHDQFSDRIKPGGDMHQSHLDFLTWAAQYDDGGLDMRSKAQAQKWLKMMPCPVLTLDGTQPPENHFEIIRQKLLERELKFGELDLF